MLFEKKEMSKEDIIKKLEEYSEIIENKNETNMRIFTHKTGEKFIVHVDRKSSGSDEYVANMVIINNICMIFIKDDSGYAPDVWLDHVKDISIYTEGKP